MKWPVVSLEDVISLEYGAALPAARRDSSGVVPVAGSNGVDGYHSEAFIKGPGIVVGRKGSSGKGTWFDSDFWPIDTTFYVRPKMLLELRWIFYLLHHLRLDRLSIVTGVPGLNRNDAYNCKISLPPLSEQRRIVEILDQADALRTKRAQANTKTEGILPALYYKMFCDPATNPMGWRKGQLGLVIDETQYGTSARANTEGKGIVVIRMNNIDSLGRLELHDLKHIVLDAHDVAWHKLEPGDLLFNRTNSKELVGKTGLWQGATDAVPASYLIRVRVDRGHVLPEFIWAYMNTSFIKQVLFDKARRAIGMANINAQELRALPVVIPDLETQRAFARVLSGVDSIGGRLSRTKEKLDQLFQTLLHRAFSGDLTAKWRKGHMKELLAEMEEQAKYLAAHERQDQRENAALQESLFWTKLLK
jgi:type I restriction enzyme S subunit